MNCDRRRILSATTFAAILMAGTGTGLHGEDAPAGKPAGIAPKQTSIDEAKRDFDAVKSSRNPALQEKAGLPRLSVPDLTSDPTAQGSTQSAKKGGLGLEKKSVNWLLEAMEKQPDQRRERDRSKPERESPRALRETSREEGESKSTEDGRRSESERRDAVALNPLTRFLGTWMTPGDYALLKPGLEKSNLPGSAALNPSNASPFGAIAALPGTDAAFGATAPSAPHIAAPTRENPYLQPLNLGAVPGPAAIFPPNAVVPGHASAGVAPVSVGPLLPPPPQTRIPEFAKPATDEKYLKQLKRF